MLFITLLDDRLNFGFMLPMPLKLLFRALLPPDGVLGFSFSSFFLPSPRLPNVDVEAEPLLLMGDPEECRGVEAPDCC